MSERFEIVETNPNDACGGGGCLCSESKVEDCTGPFAVFYVTETNSGNSPHVVLGLGCAKAVAASAVSGDLLAGGEVDPGLPVMDSNLSPASISSEIVREDDVPEV